MIENIYKVKSIEIEASAKCFCPLGPDWYTNQFCIYMDPGQKIPDYCDIDRWIRENLNGQSLIIEDATNRLYQHVMKEYEPFFCSIDNCVEDARHSKVTITVE